MTSQLGTKMKRGSHKPVPKETIEKILSLFYRGKRAGEEVVDNRDGTIAKELGLLEITVAAVLGRESDRVFYELNERIKNGEQWPSSKSLNLEL
jgi:hypothetical protein